VIPFSQSVRATECAAEARTRGLETRGYRAARCQANPSKGPCLAQSVREAQPGKRSRVMSRRESARRAQAIQRDSDEPADRNFRTAAASSSEGVKAKARKLVRRHVIPDVAALCGLGQQVSKHAVDLVLRSGDLLVAMEERAEFGVVVPAGVARD